MTNGEKIRQMSDEVLADMMMCHFQKMFNCQICGEIEKCIAAARGGINDKVRYLHCRQKHLDWLKQEVKE